MKPEGTVDVVDVSSLAFDVCFIFVVIPAFIVVVIVLYVDTGITDPFDRLFLLLRDYLCSAGRAFFFTEKKASDGCF